MIKERRYSRLLKYIMDKPKIGGLPSKAILNPEQLRAEQIAKEEEKRFKKIAKKVFAVLEEEKIIISELPKIISAITREVNNKWDKALISKVLNDL